MITFKRERGFSNDGWGGGDRTPDTGTRNQSLTTWRRPIAERRVIFFPNFSSPFDKQGAEGFEAITEEQSDED